MSFVQKNLGDNTGQEPKNTNSDELSEAESPASPTSPRVTKTAEGVEDARHAWREDARGAEAAAGVVHGRRRRASGRGRGADAAQGVRRPDGLGAHA